jgi:hypothetical protein
LVRNNLSSIQSFAAAKKTIATAQEQCALDFIVRTGSFRLLLQHHSVVTKIQGCKYEARNFEKEMLPHTDGSNEIWTKVWRWIDIRALTYA